jgi:hypothetical protein
VSKWRTFSFVFNRENREKSRVDGDESRIVLVKNCLVKSEGETLRCCDARAIPFVAKVRGEFFLHFQTFAVKRHNSMQN